MENNIETENNLENTENNINTYKPKDTMPDLNPKPHQSFGQMVLEIGRFALVALLVVIPIRVFVAEPFIVSGSSMFPSFQNGNYLIIDKVSYKLSEPQRQDVIVFKYPNDTKKFFIKRIIGLPNETVDINGSVVTITNTEHPNGFNITEPYVKNKSENNTHLELKEGEYFVMGDNRSASSDSRYWGVLPEGLITGKAFLRLLPISKIDIFPADYKQK